MNLTEIPNGERVLLDSNILIYAASGDSRQCVNLFERCRNETIQGYITTVTVAECCHRWMMLEAVRNGFIPSSNPARALSSKPAVVTNLSDYATRVHGLIGGTLQVRSIEAMDFVAALHLQKQWGVLTNDSLQLAVAERLGIKAIASADAGFDSVQGLIVYKPSDLTI